MCDQGGGDRASHTATLEEGSPWLLSIHTEIETHLSLTCKLTLKFEANSI